MAAICCLSAQFAQTLRELVLLRDRIQYRDGVPLSKATNVEGLPDRSITEYQDGDIQREGVRGVGGDTGVNARVRTYGGILAISAWGSGSEIERRPLRPGLPTIDIIFVERGEFEYLDGTSWLRSEGPLMIAPSGLPYRARFLGDWRFIVARVPRQALLPYVPTLSDTVGVYSELSVSERAMQAFLQQSVESDLDVTETDSRTVDRLVLDMAGTLVLGRQGRAFSKGTPKAMLWERALGLISEQRGNAQLTPGKIAADLDVSLRHLQTVFADADSSVAGEIRRERGRVARSLLQDPRLDHLDIEDIATEAGFGSSASLRRAMEDLYGVGPRELRMSR